VCSSDLAPGEKNPFDAATGRITQQVINQSGGPKARRNQSAVAYRFDIILHGGSPTPMENRT
jgi:hypothetical protein